MSLLLECKPINPGAVCRIDLSAMPNVYSWLTKILIEWIEWSKLHSTCLIWPLISVHFRLLPIEEGFLTQLPQHQDSLLHSQLLLDTHQISVLKYNSFSCYSGVLCSCGLPWPPSLLFLLQCVRSLPCYRSLPLSPLGLFHSTHPLLSYCVLYLFIMVCLTPVESKLHRVQDLVPDVSLEQALDIL